MRFRVALGALCFAFPFLISYRYFSAVGRGPARIVVQRSALPVPAAAPAPPVSAAPAVPDSVPPAPDDEALHGESQELSPLPSPAAGEDELPPPEPLSSEPPWRASVEPAPATAADDGPGAFVGAAPEKRRPRRTRRPSVERPEAPGPPLAPCLVCGEESESWVEVDGSRTGYCRRHMSRPEKPPRGRTRRAAAAPEPTTPGEPEADTESTAPAEASEPPAAQCRGITRSRTRCRRKTKDSSGLCYQHRRR